MVGCKCGGICNDKHCPCQKDNLSCGDGCECSSDKCMNRQKRPDIRGFFLPPSKKLKASSSLISETSNNIEDEDNDINCSTSTEGTSTRQDTSNKDNTNELAPPRGEDNSKKQLHQGLAGWQFSQEPHLEGVAGQGRMRLMVVLYRYT